MKATSNAKQNDRLFVEASRAWDNGDLKKAFELFSQVADSGDRSSQLNLGYFFDRGLHVNKNFRQAMHWYYLAYRQGCTSAAINIATLHRDSGRVEKMVWWYRRAVTMGDDEASLELGKCYETGLGIAKNPERAMQCYQRVLAGSYVTDDSRELAAIRLRRIRRVECSLLNADKRTHRKPRERSH